MGIFLKVAIIGGGAAGMSAASRIKKLRPDWDVKVFERAPYVSHAPCGIPFYVAGFVKDLGDLCAYDVSFFRESRGIDVRLRAKVVEIDTGFLRVLEHEGGTEKERTYEWDRLLFATGARAASLNVTCEELEGVLCVHYIENGQKVRELAENSEKVVIVGSGYIGIEMAEALTRAGKKVILIEKEENPLPEFDREIGSVLKERLGNKLEARFGENVEAIDGRDRVERIITDRSSYECEMVIVAIGSVPNIELAKELGVRLGESGAIATNRKLETNVENVYAAGDCAETRNIVTGKEDWIPLAAPANKMGYVAGVNISGYEMEFPGALNSHLTGFYDLEIGKTGLSEKEAIEHGYDTISAVIKTKSNAKYLPNGDILVKIVSDVEGNVLGVQAAGKGVSKRIYAAAALLHKKAHVRDFFFVDLPYFPPDSRVWDPLVIAARNLFRKIGVP